MTRKCLYYTELGCVNGWTKEIDCSVDCDSYDCKWAKCPFEEDNERD